MWQVFEFVSLMAVMAGLIGFFFYAAWRVCTRGGMCSDVIKTDDQETNP